MHVLVLGAGVVGLTTAHALARDGHRVTVVERNAGVALEASRANGGQLSYEYVAPLAGPGVPAKLPGWLTRRDSPVRFRPVADPAQWAWGLRFLAACTAAASEAATRRLLALGALSRTALHRLLAEEELRFEHRRAGKLVVHSSAAAHDAARRQMALQRGLGSVQEAVDAEACVVLEPALRHIRPRLVGGIHTPGEEAADCARFCAELERVLAGGNRGVEILKGTAVRQILAVRGRVLGVATDSGALEADAVVLALGLGGAALARPLGLRLPVWPLRGYSLTLPARDAGAPRVSVTDDARKVVYARLGGSLRVAGMADLGDARPGFELDRLDQLVREARAAFPEATDWDGPLGPWCGLRPATPTSVPILGAAPGLPNLLLNLGHGALGFTLSMGSAQVTADLLAGRAPSIPLDGFALPGA